MIASTDQARRRIERDLHDGAQQRLVAVTMQLGLAAELVEKDPAAAAGLLVDLVDQTERALAELRNLCLGVYPAVLSDFGLAEALRSIPRTPDRLWRDDTQDVGRFDEAVEAAVYFACAEAVQNAIKHAGPGAAIAVGCARTRPNRVRFWVCDDGCGFAVGRDESGTGLASIVDRVRAAGGTVHILSEPGAGVRVVGSVPTLRESALPGRRVEPRETSTFGNR